MHFSCSIFPASPLFSTDLIDIFLITIASSFFSHDFVHFKISMSIVGSFCRNSHSFQTGIKIPFVFIEQFGMEKSFLDENENQLFLIFSVSLCLPFPAMLLHLLYALAIIRYQHMDEAKLISFFPLSSQSRDLIRCFYGEKGEIVDAWKLVFLADKIFRAFQTRRFCTQTKAKRCEMLFLRYRLRERERKKKSLKTQ